MRYGFSISNSEEFYRYQAFMLRNKDKIEEYIDYLEENFRVEHLPKLIVLSNYEIATEVHGNIIIPAYTNDVRMVLTPDLEVWKAIYLQQISDYDGSAAVEEIKEYYTNSLSENHILQLVGHELAHHSELFMGDFESDREEGIWFEEGMAEYISSRYFLTTAEMEQSKKCEIALIKLFEEKYGHDSIETFGENTYDGSYASIFYNYWRSSLMIERLVDELGTIDSVFEKYHEWYSTGTKLSLAQWFGLE